MIEDLTETESCVAYDTMLRILDERALRKYVARSIRYAQPSSPIFSIGAKIVETMEVDALFRRLGITRKDFEDNTQFYLSFWRVVEEDAKRGVLSDVEGKGVVEMIEGILSHYEMNAIREAYEDGIPIEDLLA